MRARTCFTTYIVVLLVMIITGCAPAENTPPLSIVGQNDTLATQTTSDHAGAAAPAGVVEEATNQNPPEQYAAQTPTAEPNWEAGISQQTPTAIEENTDNPAVLASARHPTGVIQPTPTPVVPIPIPAQACEDEAEFYADVTIPDGTWFSPGAAFTKTWQIRNTGSCTWEGYTLVFAYGDVMSAPLTNPLPVIGADEIADISIDMIAPTRGGEQTGNWEFQNAQGDRFGVGSAGSDYIWVQINVEWQDSGNSQAPLLQPSIPLVSPASCGATPNMDLENQILSLINAGRGEQGLTPLVSNPALNSAAREHSQDMACQDFVDHNGSDGSTWYDRVARQGYANVNSARENIYVGDPAFGGSPEGAFAWWMNSQVHRDNILNAAVSEIGIGYVYHQNSSYGGYYTVIFARP